MIKKYSIILFRTLAGLNLASVVQCLRCGPRKAVRSAVRAYFSALGIQPSDDADPLYRAIPEIDVRDLSPSPEPLLIDTRFVERDGSMSLPELIRLLTVARKQAPTRVLEIGTYFGSTTLNMAMNLPEAIIHTIDLPVEYADDRCTSGIPKDDFHLIGTRRVGAAFAGHAHANRIIQHFGDTATFDFARLGGSCDLFFIDGSHTYDYVRSDTLKCLAVASDHCAFIWHDCDPTHPGVVRWISELREAGFDVSRLHGTFAAYMALDMRCAGTAAAMERLRNRGSGLTGPRASGTKGVRLASI